MPGCIAESSLGPTQGIYRGKAVFGASGTVEVLPMLDDVCGNCERVGSVGGVVGVGRGSCCQKVWKHDPITKRYAPTWSCWFVSFQPEAVRNRWLSF
jgi:hypothetical protein